MAAVQDTEDIFSILHDGSISAWRGDNKLLILTVQCRYLAERIDPSFDRFYVELTGVETLSLSTWPNPPDLPVQVFTALPDIFKANLEILSADVENEKVVITCNQSEQSFDYCGGTLTISCQSINVFDQDKKELTIDEFDLLCQGYWDNWSKT